MPGAAAAGGNGAFGTARPVYTTRELLVAGNRPVPVVISVVFVYTPVCVLVICFDDDDEVEVVMMELSTLVISTADFVPAPMKEVVPGANETAKGAVKLEVTEPETMTGLPVAVSNTSATDEVTACEAATVTEPVNVLFSVVVRVVGGGIVVGIALVIVVADVRAITTLLTVPVIGRAPDRAAQVSNLLPASCAGKPAPSR